ncbi:MAG: hypothetical protein OQK99_04630 [Gammaproteobacteria bacterium]|jgi:hypothetical protein|nr:hypothetical protein [Gammaproteobacteria bacterium]
MGKRMCAALLALVALTFFTATWAEPQVLRFSGSGSERTPVFVVGSPWLIDWSTESEFPQTGTIEIRLHDADTDRIVGIINQAEGIARGLKLMEDVGKFSIAVDARNVDWIIDITELTPERAAELKEQAATGPSLAERSHQLAKYVPAGSFSGWMAADDSTLVLLGKDGGGWRVSIAPPCAGLSTAKTLAFVTPMAGSLGHYDSVLLEDGTRCYFERVAPASVPD